eukprot:12411328-Alexandrium_andersonii.AAC.1
MSASLVGSEMCIRDRICQPPSHRPGLGGVALRTAPPGLGAETGGSPTSVSYTHLTLPTICSV